MSVKSFIKLFEGVEKLKLYRGFGQNSPFHGNYYTTDREWASQFSQSGREVREIVVDNDLIYYDEPLPHATDEEAMEERMNLVQSEEDYIGFWVNEGVNEPDSVFLLDPEYADMFDLSGTQ